MNQLPRAKKLSSTTKEIWLCADDFAQSDMISMAILTLARQRLLNAISCLVNGAQWAEFYPDLAELKSTHYIGLHLNLTFGQPLSALWRKRYGNRFQGLGSLLKLAYGRFLDLSVVAAEIQAQIDMFTQDMHIYPDFIDGHQHIQQLPVVRDALLSVYQRYDERRGFSQDSSDGELLPQACFLRKTYNGWRDFASIKSFPKSQILALLGGIRWQRMLQKAQIASNDGFAGLYCFRGSPHYRAYFQNFLRKVTNGGLIMCHPGYPTQDASDPLADFRHYELQYFISREFQQDLQQQEVSLIFKL